MRELSFTNQFKRDYRKQTRRNKKMEKLDDAIQLLQSEGSLPQTYRPHQLSGQWSDCMECHLEGDWLLIYQVDDECVFLIRTGTHSDLFE